MDVIYWPEGLPIDDDAIARGDETAGLPKQMREMAIEDVLVTKRMADHDAPKAGVRRQTRVDGVATGGSAAREAG